MYWSLQNSAIYIILAKNHTQRNQQYLLPAGISCFIVTQLGFSSNLAFSLFVKKKSRNRFFETHPVTNGNVAFKRSSLTSTGSAEIISGVWKENIVVIKPEKFAIIRLSECYFRWTIKKCTLWFSVANNNCRWNYQKKNRRHTKKCTSILCCHRLFYLY